MNIAFIVINTYGGGAEKSNLTIIQMLEFLGHKVSIFSISKPKENIEFNVDFSISYLEDLNYDFPKRIQKAIDLYKLLRKKDFDLIIDGRTRPSILKEFIFQKIVYPSIPKISLVHSFKMENYVFKNKSVSHFFYKKDFIVTVSKEIRERLIADYKHSNVTYIPNAIFHSTKEKSILFDKSYGNYILFFGRLVDNIKDISFIIKAYAKSQLPKKGIQFMILGSGPDRESLEELSDKFQLTNSIKFIPFTAEPEKYIKNAKLTVMASRYEGFPMSIIESLSFGVPVVTTNFKSGPSEIIVTGENGILVKEKNLETFTKALEKMLADDIFYQKCADGSTNSAAKFKFENVANQWKKLLEKI